MAYNEKLKNYSLKYAKENLKRVPLDLPKEKYEELKSVAEGQGYSVNGYIKAAISEKIARGERSGKADGAAMQGHGLDGDAAPAQGP